VGLFRHEDENEPRNHSSCRRQPADSHFLVRELLPSLGYKALSARNGKTGLEILHTTPVSLLLLDMQLPDFTGLDLLRQLASEGRKVPTILITAHGSLEIAVDAFRLGVQDYLTKRWTLKD